MLNIQIINDIGCCIRNCLIISKMKKLYFCGLYMIENQVLGCGLAEKLLAKKFGGGLHMRYLCNSKSAERE